MRPLMDRISRDEMLMRVATVISGRGTCTRAYVGAVIALDGRIISSGYVGAPAGMPHCLEIGDEIGPDGGCVRTVHAEANAIAWAARSGASTEEAELYCTHEPCLRCAQLLINAGISKVTYEHPYRNHDGLELLSIAGIDVIHLPMPEPEPFHTERTVIEAWSEDEPLPDPDSDREYKRIN